MKIAMFTILSRDFIIGYKIFMKSFLYNNPWFDLDLIILDIDLIEEHRTVCRNVYPNIIFRKPNYAVYRETNFSNTHPKLQNTFYFLDAFCQYDYDKIISVDVDMIVLGSLLPVFMDTGDGISGCKGYSRRKDRIVNQMNAGLFVIGKEFLNEKTYMDLIEISKAGFSMPEQKTMNIYFDGRIDWIPKVYNCEKRMINTRKYRKLLSGMVVLHFVGLKPWQNHSGCTPNEKGYEVYENMWWSWKNKPELEIAPREKEL